VQTGLGKNQIKTGRNPKISFTGVAENRAGAVWNSTLKVQVALEWASEAQG